MNLTKKIALNTFIHTAGKFGASFVGIFIVAILTRYLGVDGYGAYTIIFAYLFFFAILSDLGLYVVTVNELGRSKYGEENFFNNIFSIRFFSALLLMVAAGILVWMFPYSGLIKTGIIIASASIFLNLIDQIIVAFFQNKIDMKRVAVAELAGKIITLVFTILVVWFDRGLIWILVTVILGFSGNLIINLFYLRKFIKLKFSFDFEIWQSVLKKSWPIAVTSIFSLVYFKADTLFLSILPVNPAFASSNNQAVGIYGAPYKILEVLIAWPAIFMGLVSPLLSRAAVKEGRVASLESLASEDVQDSSFAIIFQKAFEDRKSVV